jgi:hypothetical protein
MVERINRIFKNVRSQNLFAAKSRFAVAILLISDDIRGIGFFYYQRNFIISMHSLGHQQTELGKTWRLTFVNHFGSSLFKYLFCIATKINRRHLRQSATLMIPSEPSVCAA